MLLKECYDLMGEDYDAVKQRIPRDESIKKYVLKFTNEKSFNNLNKSLEAGDYAEAFRAVHSLKGVCANLGFKKLEASSGLLTELLRNHDKSDVDKERCSELLEAVTKDYNTVVEAARNLLEE